MDLIKLIDSGREIIDEIKSIHKKIIIYGTGNIAQRLYNILSDEAITVECFTCSDGFSFINNFNERAVHEISKISSIYKDTDQLFFFVAANDIHHDYINNMLHKNGYTNKLFFTGEYALSLLTYYCNKYCNFEQIDLGGDIISFQNIHLKNFITMETSDAIIHLSRICDIVFPSLLNNYFLSAEGPYEYESVVLPYGGIVLDCGANIGMFTCLAAAKKNTVYAFEPTPHLLDELADLSPYYDNRIIPCSVALSDHTGSELFGVSTADGLNSLLIDKEVHNQSIMVETTTIDEFVQNHNLSHVDFIKSDIEGAERYMLAGAKKTLATFAPKLAICTYHLKDDPQVLEALIKEANPDYKITHMWKKLYAYV